MRECRNLRSGVPLLGTPDRRLGMPTSVVLLKAPFHVTCHSKQDYNRVESLGFYFQYGVLSTIINSTGNVHPYAINYGAK